MKKRNVFRVFVLALCFTFALSLVATVSHAKTKGEINSSVKAAMDRFHKQVKGANEYLKMAKGCSSYQTSPRPDSWWPDSTVRGL